jgi:protein-L-isoaspartate(D-aspartate) O-methyltransferase
LKTVGADELRDELIETVKMRHDRLELPWREEIGRAMRAVPRHLFTGDSSLEDAYTNDAVVTRRDDRGTALSSVSAPWLQAVMLGQLDVRPGDRVLEVGSGGYNAALLRELARAVAVRVACSRHC